MKHVNNKEITVSEALERGLFPNEYDRLALIKLWPKIKQDTVSIQEIINYYGLDNSTKQYILERSNYTGEIFCSVHSIYDRRCHYKYGLLHRADGPAIEGPDGHEEWWMDGRLHREDGPAIVHPNGHKEWCLEGRLHRIGGPARVYASGHLQWWVDGVFIKEEKK